jgi:hypothetical protein
VDFTRNGRRVRQIIIGMLATAAGRGLNHVADQSVVPLLFKNPGSEEVYC